MFPENSRERVLSAEETGMGMPAPANASFPGGYYGGDGYGSSGETYGYYGEDGYIIDGGELPGVVIYGYYGGKDKDEEKEEEDDGKDIPNPGTDIPFFPGGGGGGEDIEDGYPEIPDKSGDGYPGYPYDPYDPYYMEYGNAYGEDSEGSSTGNEELDISSLVNELKEYLMNVVKSAITESAEVAHEVFEMVVPIAEKHPEEMEALRGAFGEVSDFIDPYVESDANEMGWDDLLSIWLFELERGNGEIVTDKDTGKDIYALHFEDDAKTTKDLQKQEGVLQARDKAIAQIRENNLSEIKHSWTYDVSEFVDGMKEMNVATSFLGSYTTTVTIVENQGGTYTLNYKVTNETGWESATRLRVAHEGSSYHEGIIPNCDRGTGIGLGGTIREKWTWTETFKED